MEKDQNQQTSASTSQWIRDMANAPSAPTVSKTNIEFFLGEGEQEQVDKFTMFN